VIVGVLAGVLVTAFLDKSERPVIRKGQSAMPAVSFEQEVALLKAMAAKEPDNFNAWAQLGHKYYDAQQPKNAVDAYAKALLIQPDNVDILTDQGTMYRRMGLADKALDRYSRAQAIRPDHLQSLFNLGIVYYYDLQDFAQAKKIWGRFLQLNPSGPGSQQVRRDLAALKNKGSGMMDMNRMFDAQKKTQN